MNTTHILTEHTCGEACWFAREEVCRCSCGGRNHGCLSDGGNGKQPQKMRKIDGYRYRLVEVGYYIPISNRARELTEELGEKTWPNRKGNTYRAARLSESQVRLWSECAAMRDILAAPGSPEYYDIKTYGVYGLWERVGEAQQVNGRKNNWR
jgi:hypothetical protein